MGLRGPQPTPTAILRARGSWLVNHRKDEPQPEKGGPPCPRWLNKDARKIWKALIPQLPDELLLVHF
jgi:phage terminase small subunit